MNKVSILTPQNVVIEMILASQSSRVFAFIIDQSALIIFIFLLTWAIKLTGFNVEYIYYLIIIPIVFLYSLLLETLNQGRTVGKMMMGIKVRRTDGSEIGITEASARWLFRIPDLYLTGGTLAFILTGSTEKSQRLGDRVAGTIVVENKKSFQSIKKVLNNKVFSDYEVKYPMVTRLSEEDVVWIKQTVSRATQFNNAVHREAINKLSKKIATLLEIKKLPKDPMKFLKTIIKDYVVSTR